MPYQIVVPTSFDFFDQEWRDQFRSAVSVSGPAIDRVVGPTEVVYLDDGEIRQEVVAKTEDNTVPKLVCKELMERCLCAQGKEVISHRYFTGLTVEETAEEMRISPKRVRRIEALALKAMRRGQRI